MWLLFVYLLCLHVDLYGNAWPAKSLAPGYPNFYNRSAYLNYTESYSSDNSILDFRFSDILASLYQSEPFEPEDDISQKIFKKGVYFVLYTREHPKGVKISPTTSKARLLSYFGEGLETKFVVHGWYQTHRTLLVLDITKAYLSERDVNMVSVDWGGVPGTLLSVSPEDVTLVGVQMAEMAERLVVSKATSLRRLHFIGHSVGAHIAAIAARTMDGKVARITGLDSSGARFDGLPDDLRLSRSDARFVDIIHTADLVYGYLEPHGHADFYANGGLEQPGCPEITLILAEVVFCSHRRAIKYFIESIHYPEAFVAVECDSWNDFITSNCSYNAVECMGDKASKKARGIFALATNSEPPYAVD